MNRVCAVGILVVAAAVPACTRSKQPQSTSEAAPPAQTRLLSETEFQATFAPPMKRVSPDEAPLFDYWKYFDRIPRLDFSGHDCSAKRVTNAYRHPSGRFEHILVDSEARDIFMALVLDRQKGVVLGHRLLDLRALYGQ